MGNEMKKSGRGPPGQGIGEVPNPPGKILTNYKLGDGGGPPPCQTNFDFPVPGCGSGPPYARWEPPTHVLGGG